MDILETQQKGGSCGLVLPSFTGDWKNQQETINSGLCSVSTVLSSGSSLLLSELT